MISQAKYVLLFKYITKNLAYEKLIYCVNLKSHKLPHFADLFLTLLSYALVECYFHVTV